jgi:hypothetical protein
MLRSSHKTLGLQRPSSMPHIPKLHPNISQCWNLSRCDVMGILRWCPRSPNPTSKWWRVDPHRICLPGFLERKHPLPLLCKLVVTSFPQAWGLSIHPWDSSTHEGTNWSSSYYCFSIVKSSIKTKTMPSRGPWVTSIIASKSNLIVKSPEHVHETTLN